VRGARGDSCPYRDLTTRPFVYDPADMTRWRLAAAIALIMALSVVGVRYALEQRSQEKNEQQKREIIYHSRLLSYSAVLKPGMNRKDVEDYLRTKSITFRQMCCVDFKDTSPRGYDDLAKIGQEAAPWACSEKNVYVAFQFDTSDTLKSVTLYRWLEGCL
jgi:hypothetical protein